MGLSSDELLKRRSKNLIDFDKTQKEIEECYNETERVREILENTPVILEDLDKQFEQETSLKGKDIAFLFGAAVLQSLRWILLPNLDLDYSKISNRLTSVEGGKIEKDGIRKFLKERGYNEETIKDIVNNKNHIHNYTWRKLLVAPVPYDAMRGSGRIAIPGISDEGKELFGKNHHVATWGHDPIVGWVIGPLNITARMITFRDFQTFHVAQVGDTFEQIITYRTNMLEMIIKAINAWQDDSKKLFVSVVKQGLHQQSDKYTKQGLPIPLLKADTAQKLLDNGWNSNEVERMFAKTAKNLGVIGAQYGIAVIIDNIIRALHLLCYDESIDGSYSTYSVKTQKIICYSTALAEITNAIYVIATEDVGKLDIGGYIHFVCELMHNSELQRKVKEEFIFGNYKKMIEGNI